MIWLSAMGQTDQCHVKGATKGAKMNPETRNSQHTELEETINGHKVVFKSEGYLHLAGYVDGELVIEDRDNYSWVKKETRTHAKYLPNNNG